MNFEKLLPFILSTTAVGVCGLLYGFWKSYKLNKNNPDEQKFATNAELLKSGVLKYMSVNFKFILLFIISVGILTFFYGKHQENTNGIIAGTVIIGALTSAVASFISSKIAANSVSKVTIETKKSYSDGFKKAVSASNSIAIISCSSIESSLARWYPTSPIPAIIILIFPVLQQV